MTDSSIPVDQFVREFGDQIEAGNGSVFAGAGMSTYAKLADWDKLIAPFKNRLKVGGEVTDQAQLMQYAQDDPGIGRGPIEAAVYKAISKVPPKNPSVFHDKVGALGLKSIWTTNYDDLIEHFSEDEQIFVVSDDDALSEPRARGRTPLYKMHGTIDRKAGVMREMVLSRSDYENYERTRPRFWTLLQAEFLTGSLFFVGFSFDDPNVGLIFRLVRQLKLEKTSNHYAVLKKPTGDPAKQALHECRVREFAQVGVRIVEIEDYDEIAEIVMALSVRAKPAQVYMAGSPPGRKKRGSGGAYPTKELSDGLASFCVTLGHELASARLPVRFLGGSAVAAEVGYALLRDNRDSGTYRSKDFVMLRRCKDERLEDPRVRLGRIEFAGDDQDELRSHAFSQVRAAVFIGGGTGTKSEIKRAQQQRIGVIPIASTGGASRAVWVQMSENLERYRLGGGRIDQVSFAQLDHGNPRTVARATVKLLRQAMFLDPT